MSPQKHLGSLSGFLCWLAVLPAVLKLLALTMLALIILTEFSLSYGLRAISPEGLAKQTAFVQALEPSAIRQQGLSNTEWRDKNSFLIDSDRGRSFIFEMLGTMSKHASKVHITIVDEYFNAIKPVYEFRTKAIGAFYARDIPKLHHAAIESQSYFAANTSRINTLADRWQVVAVRIYNGLLALVVFVIFMQTALSFCLYRYVSRKSQPWAWVERYRKKWIMLGNVAVISVVIFCAASTYQQGVEMMNRADQYISANK